MSANVQEVEILCFQVCVCVCACIYPADVLALWTRRKGLGADYSVTPDKKVLLVQLKPSLFGPDHGGGGVREALHARLFIHLWKDREMLRSDKTTANRSNVKLKSL